MSFRIKGSADWIFPFSGGILANSLVKLGIPLREAVNISREIKARLKTVYEDNSVIESSVLENIVEQKIREKYGYNAAESYSRRYIRDYHPVLYVKFRDTEIPFIRSKLAKSIVAAGVDHYAAFGIAAEVEFTFLSRGSSIIKRKELQKEVHRTLTKNLGEETADRYISLHSIRRPAKPLIILTAGATGTGKSTIASELAYRLDIKRLISTDSIRQILRSVIDESENPYLHKSSYNGKPLLKSFRNQAENVMRSVDNLIGRCVVENISMIIEGVHLIPGEISEIIKSYDINAFILTLSISNREELRKRFYFRQSEAPERLAGKYIENIDNILKIQDLLLDDARQKKLPVFKNENSHETCNRIVEYIIDKYEE
ncbi:MAG: hypothetical protein ACLFQK_07020 [Fibrobacterota bacterium]